MSDTVFIDGNCPLCKRRNHAPASCEDSYNAELRAVGALMPPLLLPGERTALVINDLISERRDLASRLAKAEAALREAIEYIKLDSEYPAEMIDRWSAALADEPQKSESQTEEHNP